MTGNTALPTPKDYSTGVLQTAARSGGNKDGFLSEAEFIQVVTEASGNVVSEQQAREWFRDLITSSGSENQLLSVGEIETVAGDIDNQLKSMKKLILEQYTFSGDGSDAHMIAKFHEIAGLPEDGEKEPMMTKNEFLAYMKTIHPASIIFDEAQMSERFDMMAKRGGEEDYNRVSLDTFLQEAAEFDRGVLAQAENPPTTDEKLLKAITELTHMLRLQLMRPMGSGGSGGL